MLITWTVNIRPVCWIFSSRAPLDFRWGTFRDTSCRHTPEKSTGISAPGKGDEWNERQTDKVKASLDNLAFFIVALADRNTVRLHRDEYPRSGLVSRNTNHVPSKNFPPPSFHSVTQTFETTSPPLFLHQTHLPPILNSATALLSGSRRKLNRAATRETICHRAEEQNCRNEPNPTNEQSPNSIQYL